MSTAMIRKWLKFNTSFLEHIKNSAGTKIFEQKWATDGLSHPHSINLSLDKFFSTSSSGKITRTVWRLYHLPDEMELSDSDESETAVADKTELFEIKGPNESGFLIEVRAEDLQDVRRELNNLKGDHFQYDKSVIGWFTIKCMLTAESMANSSREQQRLARVAAIASGSEEMHKIDDSGSFLFVNSIDRTLRAKRILEKLGYKISGILYRFQPKEKISLDDAFRDICHDFLSAVERLPKVISITHNL